MAFLSRKLVGDSCAYVLNKGQASSGRWVFATRRPTSPTRRSMSLSSFLSSASRRTPAIRCIHSSVSSQKAQCKLYFPAVIWSLEVLDRWSLTTAQHRSQCLRPWYCHRIWQDRMGSLCSDYEQSRGMSFLKVVCSESGVLYYMSNAVILQNDGCVNAVLLV